MSFVSRKGAVVDVISRPEALDVNERRLADWAAGRGMFVLFGKALPLEDDEEQFEPFFTYQLGIEEMVGGKIVAQLADLDRRVLGTWPEAWEHVAALMLASFKKTKAEVLA
jgi:hypothetical protein